MGHNTWFPCVDNDYDDDGHGDDDDNDDDDDDGCQMVIGQRALY